MNNSCTVDVTGDDDNLTMTFERESDSQSISFVISFDCKPLFSSSSLDSLFVLAFLTNMQVCVLHSMPVHVGFACCSLY